MNKDIRKIYASLLSRLLDNSFDSSGLLPKETDLADEFNTNRMNAHRAVKLLEKHNLVIRKKSAGTRVNPHFDREKVFELFKEANRKIYVMYSATPHYVHWNEASFTGLEKIVEDEGFSVTYRNIPSGCTRDEFTSSLNEISKANASALVIFPDMDDSVFLKNNGDLLLDFKMPVFMLNRSGEPMLLDMVSFVEMDLFADGIYVGNLLRKNKARNVVMIKYNCHYWAIRRFEGVKMGLAHHSGHNSPQIENINVIANGIKETIARIHKSKGDIVIVAVHNEVAAQVIDAAKKENLEISRDYELISFDDNPLYRSYNLTSMAVPTVKVGEIFGQMICDNSWLGNHRGKISIKLGSDLVVRESYIPRII